MSWLALIRPGDWLVILISVGAVGSSIPIFWQGGLADRAIIRQEGRVFAANLVHFSALIPLFLDNP